MKNGLLRESLALHHIDIIGLSEINIKWDRIYHSNRLKQRVFKWWENSHCSYAYNYKDLSKAIYQPGGTALISLHSSSHRVIPKSLSDPHGLGRWTSTLYNGKRGINLRIIQVYCPSPPCSASFNSSYAQQHRYFLQSQLSDCPRQLFFQHLSTFIQERLQAQEQIVIMGDFNHVVDSDKLLHFLNQHHLHNIHQTLNSSYHTRLATYDRGSRTIDAIFASPGITATCGGFLGFKTFPSDHRLLWCDISFHILFGSPLANIIPPSRRRLKCEDPRSVNLFCQAYQRYLTDHGLLSSIHSLVFSISGPLTPQQQTEFERIDKLRVQFMLRAEKNCRKFKVGGIEFSPKVQHQRD